MPNIFEVIRNEALRENADLKKTKTRGHDLYEGNEQKWGKISENIDFRPFFRSPVVDIRDRPVSLLKFANFDPYVRSTYGHYTLKYVPAQKRLSKKSKSYQIINDLVRFVPTVSGPLHWHHLCERIPELAWIERNSTLTDELFSVAKRHPGVPFEFTVDWVKYDKKIQEIADKEEIDIDNKTFVTYMTSQEKLDELNRTYLLAPVRGKAELSGTVDEVARQYGTEADE